MDIFIHTLNLLVSDLGFVSEPWAIFSGPQSLKRSTFGRGTFLRLLFSEPQRDCHSMLLAPDLIKRV